MIETRIGIDPCVFLALHVPGPGVRPAEADACRRLVEALEQGRVTAVSSAFAVAEVMYALGREGQGAERRRLVRAWLTEALRDQLELVPVSPDLANAAAEFRLTHYHRQRAPISYADALYVVTARESGASPLVTLDGPLLALNDSEIVPPSALRFS